MALHPGFPVDLAGGTAIDTALSLMGTVATFAGDGSARAGVFPTTALQTIVSARQDMKVDVAPFSAVLSRTGQGAVFVCNDGIEQVTIPVSPVSGARIDVVWVRHKDAQVPNSDNLSELVLGVTSGFATAGTPAAPTIPDGALELAQVRVAAGAAFTNSGNVVITQTFRFTAMAGGRVVVRDAADRDSWTPHEGAECYLMSNKRTYVRRGSAWVPLTPVALEVNGNTNADGYLTVPHTLSAVPTYVQFTRGLYGADAIDLIAEVLVAAKSNTSVTLRMIRRDTNQWFANNPVRGSLIIGMN